MITCKESGKCFLSVRQGERKEGPGERGKRPPRKPYAAEMGYRAEVSEEIRPCLSFTGSIYTVVEVNPSSIFRIVLPIRSNLPPVINSF